MKTLVIGGNGFIGTNLVNALVRAGHQVKVFDRYPSRFASATDKVEYVVGDLGNHGEVQEAVTGIDAVFHLAYTTLPHTSNEDPVYDVRSNLVDTVQLLQHCVTACVRKFVFVSSGGTVYGIPQQIPIREDHPTNPICSYGITKLAIEKYLHLFHRLSGLDYVVMRISNPYGEHQNPNAKQGAIGVFLGNVMRDKPIEIWGDGEVIRDYIYIGDAVCALLKAMEYEPTATGPRIFNIGAGQGYSLNQLVATIQTVLARKIKVQYTVARPEDVSANVLDIEQARHYLRWQPEIGLNDGIARTWQWLTSISLTSVQAKH
jgi:UDP-glucose 4-epimerase